MLDYIGSYRGRAFAIETKAPGETPTPRQEATIEAMEKGSMKVFVVDDTPDWPVEQIAHWVRETDRELDAMMALRAGRP